MGKRTAYISILLFFCICGYAAADVTYRSSFGFSITLPDGWTVIRGTDVKDTPDIAKAALHTAEKNNTIRNLPQELYHKLKEKLSGGEIEYFYKTGSPVFNIAVYRDVGTIAQPKEGEVSACQSFIEEFGKLSTKPVTFFECRFGQMGGAATLYLIANAYRDNEKYIQYLVQRSPDNVLLFTASADRDQDFDMVRNEFDRVMATLQLP